MIDKKSIVSTPQSRQVEPVVVMSSRSYTYEVTVLIPGTDVFLQVLLLIIICEC